MRIALIAMGLVACAPPAPQVHAETPDERAVRIHNEYVARRVAEREETERRRTHVDETERLAAEGRALLDGEKRAEEERKAAEKEADCATDRALRRERMADYAKYVAYRDALDAWTVAHCIRVDHGKPVLQTRETHDGIVYKQWATVGIIETRCDGTPKPAEVKYDHELLEHRNAQCRREDGLAGGEVVRPRRHPRHIGPANTYLGDPDEE